MKQVAVLRADRLDAVAGDGVAEIEIDGIPGRADAVARVAAFLGGPRGHVARHEIAEGRVPPLEEIVAVLVGNLVGGTVVPLLLGHPHAAVVAEAFAHQRELGLVVSAGGDAGGMNLREARIGEIGPALVTPPDRRHVAVLGVGRKVIDVAVAAGRQHDRVAGERFIHPGDQVAGDDAAGHTVDQHQVEHFAARDLRHLAVADLPHHGADTRPVGAAGPSGRGRKTCARPAPAEGPVGERPAVLAGERDAQGRAMVDDQVADLGEAVDVRLAAAEIAPFYRVVKEPPDAVAVVGIILGGVDAALGGDAVGPAGRILQTKGEDVVAQLGERSGGRRAGQPRPHHEDRELPLVGRVDQLHLEAVAVPFLLDRPPGSFALSTFSLVCSMANFGSDRTQH